MTLEQIAETLGWALKMRRLRAAIEGVTTPPPALPAGFREDRLLEPDLTQMPGTIDHLAALFSAQVKNRVYRSGAKAITQRLSGRLIVGIEEADLHGLSAGYLAVLSVMAGHGRDLGIKGCDRLYHLAGKAKRKA